LIGWQQKLTTSPTNHMHFFFVRAKNRQVKNGLKYTLHLRLLPSATPVGLWSEQSTGIAHGKFLFLPVVFIVDEFLGL
jgi:hypothetical protein